MVPDRGIVWQLSLAITWMILQVAVGLGLVIFVHELGHFLVAKACGVKCEKFYLGFDIRSRSDRLRCPRGSASSTGARPSTASASCRWAATSRCSARTTTPPTRSARERARMPDDRMPRHAGPGAGCRGKRDHLEPRSYPAKSVPQRMADHLGGRDHEPDLRGDLRGVRLRAGCPLHPVRTRRHVSRGSPAWDAGLAPGDRILQIGGRPGCTSEHLRLRLGFTERRRHGGRQERTLHVWSSADRMAPTDRCWCRPDGHRSLEGDRTANAGHRAAHHDRTGRTTCRAYDRSSGRRSAQPAAAGMAIAIAGDQRPVDPQTAMQLIAAPRPASDRPDH